MNNKRVVITGYGIISCIGNNKQEVLTSLKEVKSGISHCKEYEELGMRSHVHGKPNLNTEEHVDRKILRFMGEGAAYNHIAMQEDHVDTISIDLSDYYYNDDVCVMTI